VRIIVKLCIYIVYFFYISLANDSRVIRKDFNISLGGMSSFKLNYQTPYGGQFQATNLTESNVYTIYPSIIS
jgi:hypothetical protein